jgi:8-hydroxy-5-deazaflavin:NADPH oxidoreductase
MRIAVMGTGMVGRAVAGRLAELGHEVMVGTRDAAATMASTEPDRMGNPPFSVWVRDHPAVKLGSFAEAAEHGAVVVNATNGNVSVAALEAAGAVNLAGKVLLDISNPLDFSQGGTLFVKDTDSLGEQIQRAFPDARVVKSLNTMNSALMLNPGRLAGGDHSVFVCGDDADAKATVTELLRQAGWRDILDLGDLAAARGVEMLMPAWLRIWQALGGSGHTMFNWKVIR